MIRRLPLVFTPQSEGGYTVTLPVLPELITEGDTLEEVFGNVGDALSAALGKPAIHRWVSSQMEKSRYF